MTKKLPTHEQRLKRAMEIGGVAYYEHSADFKEGYISPCWAEMLGHDPRELPPIQAFFTWWMEHLHPQDKSQLQKAYQDLFQGKTGRCALRLRMKHSSGSWRPIMLTSEVVERGKDGNPAFVVGMALDLAESAKVGEALRESEAKYHLLFNSGNDAVFVYGFTPAGGPAGFIEVNDVACSRLGYSREELLALSLQDIMTPQPEGDERLTLGGMRGQEKILLDRILLTKDGRRIPVEINSHLFELYGKATVLSIARDISKRRQTEEELRESQEKLRQSQKMEAIGNLTGGIAHDFNNMLTAIEGYSEWCSHHLDNQKILERGLNQIRSAVKRAADLTNQLLLFSRREPMELKPHALDEIIKGLLKLLGRLLGEDIDIRLDLDPNQAVVKMDPGKMEQVLMNLSVNARDAMPEGGAITIKSRNKEVDEAYCQHYPYARTGRFVLLSVEDTGIGMGPETVEHIFEPFFTTKAPGAGTGLGLSVVYGIVKEHRGWINAFSEEGRGARFEIFLPASREKPEKRDEPTVFLDNYMGSGQRILLVEDEQGIREVVELALSTSGYAVFTAVNAQEAYSLYTAASDSFDLVFCDVVLPDVNGLDLVEKLREITPDLKVILTSGYLDDKSRLRTIRSKGYKFLRKPFGLVELLKVIKELV